MNDLKEIQKELPPKSVFIRFLNNAQSFSFFLCVCFFFLKLQTKTSWPRIASKDSQ